MCLMNISNDFYARRAFKIFVILLSQQYFIIVEVLMNCDYFEIYIVINEFIIF